LELLIEAVSLKKIFYKNHIKIEVIKGIDLKIFKREKIAIIGKSGAGKTTLLYLLGTLEKPTEGKIYFEHVDVTDMHEDKLSYFRSEKIGFVFQFHFLIKELTALDNIILPTKIANIFNKEIIEKAKFLMNKLQIYHRKDHKPNELSGGEQQRVAIARALINDPMILMADEPTGNLDSKTSELTFDLLESVYEEMDISLLIVTHNLDIAKRMDRQILIKDGKVFKN